jgi:MarR family transcriptional regulator, negative regulator of the multidrug operon emrRAB
MHINKRTVNLLGTLGTVIEDAIAEITTDNFDHGASVSAALITLGNYPGHSVTSLATALRLSHSATVRLVYKLSLDGLVTSKAGTDRRNVSLTLTRTGLKTVKSVLSRRRARLAELLTPLAAVEKVQLAALIDKVLSKATQSIEDAERLCRFCDLENCPQNICPIEQRACILRSNSNLDAY